MSYKFKTDIENELFYVAQHMKGYMDYQGRVEELDEVYRKAEAFDEYHKIIRDYITDEDDDWDKTWDPLTGVYYDYESEESE